MLKYKINALICSARKHFTSEDKNEDRCYYSLDGRETKD